MAPVLIIFIKNPD